MVRRPRRDEGEVRKVTGRRWSRRILRHWKKVALALVGLVLAGELFLRWQYHNELKLFQYPLIYQPDPYIGYRYIPASSGKLILPEVEKIVRINERGYYGPSFEKHKKLGYQRVVIVGQSNTSGMWMQGERPLTYQLQALFDEREMQVEVINLSIDGRGRSVAMIRQIGSEVIEYEPDVILLQCQLPMRHAAVVRDVYRDYVITYDEEREGARAEVMTIVDRWHDRVLFDLLYRASYIVRAGCRYLYLHYEGKLASDLEAYVKKSAGGPIRYFFLVDTEMTSRLLKLSRFLERKWGIHLVLFAYHADDHTRRSLQEVGLPLLSVEVPLESKYFNQGLVGAHYNENGHTLIARYLCDELVTILE